MAASRSGSLKHPSLDERLYQGEKFLKWTDQENYTTPVTASVDPDGFFLFYENQRQEVLVIDLAQVRDVRTGIFARTPKDPKIRELVSLGAGPLEDKTVTIVIGTDFTNSTYVNFCTIRVEVAQLWCQELWNYVKLQNPLELTASVCLRKIHRQILLSSSEDKPLPAKAILKTFAKDKEDRKTIEKALDQTGLPSGKGDHLLRSSFQLENFKEFYLKLAQRRELKSIFESYSKSEPKKSTITVKEFLDFLNSEQRDPRLNEILHPYSTEEKAAQLIKRYEPNSHLVEKGELSQEGFLWFLMSEDNNVISQEKLEKTNDMDSSIAHYFINSSHNTYLTGHQITGRASLEMYRQVLLSGCRCIELDFWNGQKEDDEPHITHGYTLVTKMPAKDVLQVIAQYAFKTTDYPLILSFENHCNPKQQAKIAQYCEEFFGDLLMQDPLADYPLLQGQVLPSPALLRGKILIKNKKQHHFTKKNISSPISISSPSSPSLPEIPAVPLESPRINNNNNNNNSSDSEDSDSDDTDDESESSENTRKELVTSDAGTAGKESQASAEISALVNYVQPVHFRSFEHAEKRKRAYEMSSFVETSASTQLKNDPVEFVKYNKFQLSRVYPKGTRVDSSNFLPHIYWNAGCQLVALNYQTLDVAMQLNLAIFQFNQRTGFLLKPEVMRHEDRNFDPFTSSSIDNIVPATLSIQIISGQFLTDKRVGTFVEVEMYGLPCDTMRRERKFKTKTVLNGLNPIFSEEPFVFRQVILPDLAVLRVAAYEESGSKLIGHRVLPLTGLCPGYRHIPLFNESGQPLHLPCLFVYIEVKDYVPNRLIVYAEALANPIQYLKDQDVLIKERARILEALEDEVAPLDSLADGGESTPEVGSPNRTSQALELLSRKGSSKPKCQGSPSLGVNHRSNSNKSIGSKLETDRRGSVSLLNKDLTPETLEDILEQKAIKEKQQELDTKLDQLTRKRTKELAKLESSKNNAEEKLTRVPSRTKNPLQIIKKFSTVNLDGQPPVGVRLETLNKSHTEKLVGLEKECLKEETSLREKFLDAIFKATEKHMEKSHAGQLKSLEGLYNKEASEVLKRIESEDKAQDVKDNSGVSREDIQKERRERLIKKGVQERGKLKETYEMRRTNLEQMQEARRKELRAEWDKRRNSLQLLFSNRSHEIEHKYSQS